VRSASASRLRPASVGVMPRDVRSNNLTPSFVLQCLNCALTAGALVNTLRRPASGCFACNRHEGFS